MKEIWRAIPDYEGLYEVSTHGRVRSIDRVVTQFSAKAGKTVPLHRKGRVLRPNVGPHGYLLVSLSKDGVAKTRRVNRLVCSAFFGQQPETMLACHCDGDKTNNFLTNLRWDTAANNQADRRLHGTHLYGEMVGTAKFTSKEIEEIRQFRTHRECRKRYNISATHFYRVKKGESRVSA